MKQNIISINDGDVVDPYLVKEFEIDRLCSRGRYDFVGFINKNNKMLVSCPKHYKYKNQSDIGLIVRCIIKSMRKSDKGSTDKIDCNIPLQSYIDIVNYYINFGLFKNISFYYKQGYGGNVDWNRTIRCSQKILNDGNLLFIPFEIKKNKRDNNFISECMIYALNDGYEQFGKYAGIGMKFNSETLKSNFKDIEAVKKRLKEEESKYFKDTEIQLIRSLISYFSWEGSLSENSCFLTQSFNLSWEDMVQNYLNSNFYGYDDVSQKIVFKNECRKHRFQKERAAIETEEKDNHHFLVEYDHVAKRSYDNKVFLFDSKYYVKISDVNYKQVAYHYFLANGANGIRIEPENIINGLIIPTSLSYNSKVHLDRRNIDGVYIQEHYLNIRDVMEKYIGYKTQREY